VISCRLLTYHNIILILRLYFILSRRPVSVPRSGRLPRTLRVPRTRRVPSTGRLPRAVRVPRTSRVPRTRRVPRTGCLPRTGRRHVLLQRQHLAPSRCGQRPSLRPGLRTSPSIVLPPSLNGQHDGKRNLDRG